jgi:iron(III) transport system permease protein
MASSQTIPRSGAPGRPAAPPAGRARRARRPVALIAASCLVAAALCAIIGTGAAWCIERTNLPGQRVWEVLVVVPLAIPDFVVSFGWASLWTWVHGFRGAVVVMTLAVYPLVYLPVAASFRAADPGQEEVAHSLGVGRIRTFMRVTLAQARGAILGGCLLVAMVMLAEYGAFEILGYKTFTTEIFGEFSLSFSIPAACALSLVLLALSLLVLAGESGARGRGRVSRSGPLTARKLPPRRFGKAKLPVLAGFTLLTILALGVPVGSSIYWMFEGGADAITGVSLPAAAMTTGGYGIGAAALDTVLALPLALLAVRDTGRIRHVLERSTYLVLAMPGVVAAFALSYFTEHLVSSARRIWSMACWTTTRWTPSWARCRSRMARGRTSILGRSPCWSARNRSASPRKTAPAVWRAGSSVTAITDTTRS